MSEPVQCLIGKSVDVLATPALLVDLDALDHNLKLLADYFSKRPCRLRPHFKSHKCVTIAHRQVGAGSASGMTCAKLSEAEQLTAGGIGDVLIANQVVGADKARRLAELNRCATVRVAVDDPKNVLELGAAARDAGVAIGVLVEVDIGMNRCGVAPGEPTVRLAKMAAATDGLRLDGLQGYEGHLILVPDAEERRRKVTEAMGVLVRTRRAVERAGLPVGVVSGGGTGTYDITGNIDGVDEVQAGSYALMDACYKRLRPEFRSAMSVLATAISSRPGEPGRAGRIILDVGVKGLGCEFGPPMVVGFPDAKVAFIAEEHTAIENVPGRTGSRLRLIPSHGCTTSNLHRQMWAVRNGKIEAVWPIEGSGCLE